MTTIFHRLRQYAADMPYSPAILSAGFSRLTYAQLNEQIESAASALHQFGIEKNDRIAVVLPEGASNAVACLAVMSAATCAPLYRGYSKSEFESLLKSLTATAIVLGKGDDSAIRDVAISMGLQVFELENLRGGVAGAFALRAIPQKSDKPLDNERSKPKLPDQEQRNQSQSKHAERLINADDIALLLFTSGTSSRPRLVPLTHDNIASSADSIGAALQLTASDRCHFAMPLHHIHGLSTLFATIASGGSFVAMPGFSSDGFLASLDEFRPTWYSASPTIHRGILEQISSERRDLHGCGLRFIRSASAAIPEPLIFDLERTFGVPLIEAYGMTEASPQIASNRLPPFERKSGAVGVAAGPEVGIINGAGVLLAPDVTGEVVVRGRNVMSGYDADPETNSSAFVDGWMRTGDLGHLDSDGYLYITGRLKEVINRGGEKFSPRTIEDVLMEHPAVEQSAAFSVADPLLGEDVAVAIVLRPYFQESLQRSQANPDRQQHFVDEIREFCATRLAHFQVPRNIILVDEIPPGPTGKPNRSELAKRLLRDSEGETSGLQGLQTFDRPTAGRQMRTTGEPHNAAERRIASIFAEVLRIPVTDISDDFFALGGHSLTAMQVVARLQNIFNLSLPPNTVFENPTVSQLADYIAQRVVTLLADGDGNHESSQSLTSRSSFQENHYSIPTRPYRTTAPLSFTQQQVYFLEQLRPGNAYNISTLLRLEGDVCERTLGRALNEIFRRHDSLRTTFELADDGPRQIIHPAMERSLDVVDLGFIDEADRQSAAERFAEANATRPFNLSTGPLVRIRLIRLSPAERLLSIVMHHIISDGWSTGVLLRELKLIYEAFLAKQESPLKELTCQQGDFADWQHKRFSEGELDSQVSYWTQQLAGLSGECMLPTDNPRGEVHSSRGAIFQGHVSPNVVQALKAVARENRATLFTTFLSAFQALLFRHTGRTDIVVGTPAAMRTRTELEPLIGFFANTLLLRTDLSGEPTFKEVLARTMSTWIGANANQEVPLERIVEELKLERDTGGSGVFQVMFAYQNMHDVGSTSGLPPNKSFKLSDCATAKPVQVHNGTSKFPVTLYLTETDDGLVANWQYNPDLYRAGTIELFANQFQAMLGEIASDPSRRISQFKLAESERLQERLPEGFQERSADQTASSFSFIDSFQLSARQNPDSIAVIDGATTWTFKQLNERANQIARFLQARGVGAETLVAIRLSRSAEWLAVVLGIWKCGGAYLPLDIYAPAARIDWMIQDAQPELVVCRRGTENESIENAIYIDEECSAIEQLPSNNLREENIQSEKSHSEKTGESKKTGKSKKNPSASANANDLAYVIYTSGSTGQPRGVMITHGNVCHYARTMGDELKISGADRFLHTASFSFSSSVRQFVVPLAHGAACVIASEEERRDPIRLFELIRRSNATVVDLVPSFWAGCITAITSMSNDDREELLDNSLRLALSASEPLSSRVVRGWNELLKPGVERINMFGQTETCGIVLMHRVTSADEDLDVVPLGKPIAGMKAYILDESKNVVSPGTRGALHVGGPQVGRGYVGQPNRSSGSGVSATSFGAEGKAKFSGSGGEAEATFSCEGFWQQTDEGLYETGDIARHRADGVIEFVGRKDSQVKVSGVRVDPIEIENVLCSHGLVNEAIVMALGASSDMHSSASSENEQLWGFVTLSAAESDESHLGSELREFLEARLPKHLVPSRIVVLDEMPRTVSGKIDRLKLRMPQSASTTSADSADSTADCADSSRTDSADSSRIAQVESILLDVWKSVLELPTLGVDDNFFDLGGTSLLSINVMAQAARRGVKFELSKFYQHQTISGLAKEIAFSSVVPEPISSTMPSEFMSSLSSAVSSTVPSVFVSVDSLRDFGFEALTRAGLDEEGARIVTDVQLEASMRGQSTHNMISIPRYAKRLIMGKLNASPNIRIERETEATALIDGDNGPGQWVSVKAMEVAIRKANATGIGVVSVRRSNHFGAAGHYVWQAANRGLIGLCTTNGPLILAPTGGVTPTFGNNPIGVGVPAGKHSPIVLDIAMSVAPRSKIGLQVEEGKALPFGWILDSSGRPSTDLADLAAGLGIPIGGHKGYGLALIMEVLSGVLSGAGFCADHSRSSLQENNAADLGHLFIALDPARFMPTEQFLERVDSLIDQTKSGELAADSMEILVPGDAEMRAREASLRDGVSMRLSTYKTLQAYARAAELTTELQLIGQRQKDVCHERN